jgi:hypothetical protein
VLADVQLARRLERGEGYACAMVVEARARLYPQSGAAWIEVAGAYAMYDSPGSPLNQTFALGLFDEVTPDHLRPLEHFFQRRSHPVCHEISPVSGRGLLGLLTGRGYKPIEYTSVMYRDLCDLGPAPATDMRTRLARPDEGDLWARTMTRGWSDSSELSEVIYEVSRIGASAEGRVLFFAEIDGAPVAAGVLCIHGGVGLLGGSSTLPAYRRRGAQAALLHARQKYAAEAGCDVAMMAADEPGGVSQRNAERRGFRIAYTRVKFEL